MEKSDIEQTKQQILERKTKSNKRKKQDKYRTAFQQLKDGRLAEQVSIGDEQQFAIYDPERETVEYKEAIREGQKDIYPLIGNLVDLGVARFPSHAVSHNSELELVNEIQDFIYRYVDIQDDDRLVAAYYIMLTWVFDRNRTCPYLGFFGDHGSGKSRAAEVIGSLCYRPIMITGSVTSASVYRILSWTKGTLVINEFDLDRSGFAEDIIKILNCGFEQGGNVLRTKMDSSGDLEAFNAYSPKIFTYRRKKQDLAFESRVITIEMNETKRTNITIELPIDFDEQAMMLRNKLLNYRFSNYYNLPAVELDGLMHLEKRLLQTMTPILRVVKDEYHKSDIIKYITQLQNKHIAERGLSSTAEYIQTVVDLLDIGKDQVTAKDFADRFTEHGSYPISSRKAGSIFKNDLHLSTEKVTTGEFKGRSALVLDKQKILDLCDRYGVDYPKQYSPSSPTLTQDQVQSEHSEGSEDLFEQQLLSMASDYDDSKKR